MRCLWLTREYPKPTVRGDLVYAANLIDNVAAAGVSLTVLGLDQSGNERADQREVMSRTEDGVQWRIVPRRDIHRAWSLLSRLPGDAYRTGTPEYRAELTRQLDATRWDAVILNHICMGWAMEPLRRWATGKREPPPIIYISHNHEMSLKPQVAASQNVNPVYKAVLMHDARKFVRLERQMIEASALITTITEEDLALYRQDFPSTPMLCLLPGYDGTVVERREIGPAIPRKCIIFGSLVWIAKKQNLVDFLKCADPLFTEAGISLEIVGNVDEEFAREVSAWAKCSRFVGRVDDVSPHFAEARIGVMPDRVGGGFKHKNLQYVFHRVPLATMTGQASGLPLNEGTEMMVATSPEALARMVVDAIDDFERLNAMQEAAFRKCYGQFSWSVRGRQLRDALAAATVVPSIGAAQPA